LRGGRGWANTSGEKRDVVIGKSAMLGARRGGIKKATPASGGGGYRKDNEGKVQS